MGPCPAITLVVATLLAAITTTPAHATACSEPATAAASAMAAEGHPHVRAEALLCEVNRVRAERGLGALSVDWPLTGAAQAHAEDMHARSFFSHVTPDGLTLVERALRAGFPDAGTDWQLGEVLALGSGVLSTPASAVRGWLDSPGHREVVLDPGLDVAGIGLVDFEAAGGPFTVWVMVAGRRSTALAAAALPAEAANRKRRARCRPKRNRAKRSRVRRHACAVKHRVR